MLKYILFVLAILGGCATVGTAATITSTTCSITDVNAAITSASNGDTVLIKDGSCTWSSGTLTFTKAIKLRGEHDCTLGTVNGKSGIPTSCPTTITLNIASYVMNWVGVAGYAHEISNLDFEGNANIGGNGIPFGYIEMSNREQVHGSPTTLRIHHNRFNFPTSANAGNIFWIYSAVGVFDHNYARAGDDDGSGNGHIFQFQFPNWYGPSDEQPNPDAGARFGDESRYYPLDYPGATITHQSFVMEDNVIYGNNKGCTDADHGSRFDFRFNWTNRCSVTMHGLESAGRGRANKEVAVLGNIFVRGSSASFAINWMVENRDGVVSPILWNSGVDFPEGGMTASLLMNYRNVTPTSWWMSSDGTSLWDVNNSGNPQFVTNGGANCAASGGTVCTAASGGTGTVTVSGASFATNTWYGYVIKKVGCTEDYTNTFACHALVDSNTPTVITFGGIPAGTSLSFSASDTFTLEKVDHAMDMPGRDDAILLVPHRSSSGLSTSGTTATFVSDDALTDISSGDYVTVQSGDSHYEGTFQVTKTNSTTVTYTYGGGGGVASGSVTRKPTTIANFQTTHPMYQALNTNTDSTGCVTPCVLDFIYGNASPKTVRVDEHFFDYVGGAQTSSSAPFNGASGFGVGKRAKRPTTCTVGVGYLSVDQGSWNNGSFSYTINGADAGTYTQGVIDKCTATNTWTNDYWHPYTYPHPLIDQVDYLDFTTQPANVQSGSNFSSNVVVTCKAFIGGTTDTGCTGTITLTMNACGASLTGGATQTLSSGVATFTSRGATTAATGCTLLATTSGGTTATSTTSNSFDVTTNCTPDHLTFTGQPIGTSTNSSLGTVIVAIKDSGGNTCTGDTSVVTIANKAGTCTGMTLGGTKSGVATSGLFSTSNLTEDITGSCTLHATDGSLTAGDSNAFTISSGVVSLGTSASRLRRKP